MSITNLIYKSLYKVVKKYIHLNFILTSSRVDYCRVHLVVERAVTAFARKLICAIRRSEPLQTFALTCQLITRT